MRTHQLIKSIILLLTLVHFYGCTQKPGHSKNYIPVIDGDWWQVAGNPDLDELTSDEQQQVDFGIWQAADVFA